MAHLRKRAALETTPTSTGDQDHRRRNGEPRQKISPSPHLPVKIPSETPAATDREIAALVPRKAD